MGALIVLGGTRGKRVALPHAKILLNQVSGGFEGEVSDIEIQARELLALGRRLEEIIAEHTGASVVCPPSGGLADLCWRSLLTRRPRPA